MCSLLAFLSANGGSASSQQIISYIGKELYGFDAILVKEILIKIARLTKGIWKIRSDYTNRR